MENTNEEIVTNNLGSLVQKWRWLSLIIVLLVTVVAFVQLEKLQIDNSNETFFRSGDDTKKRLDEFKELFGNDDFVFILVDAADVFDKQTMLRIDDLVSRLELETPHLLEATWIGNAEYIEGVPGGIEIDAFVSNFDVTQGELDQIGDRATKDPLYKNRLVSEDRRTAGILLEFENYPDLGIDPRKDVPPAIKSTLADFPDLTTHLVGSPVMDYEMDQETARELPLWMVAALGGMAAMLLITTRSPNGIILPAATVILSVVWTLAVVATLGFTLNIFVVLVPTLLLCVGIGDAMHMVAEFRQNMNEGMSRTTALGHTLSLVSWPVFLTTLTTSAGFLAFLATDLVPLRELGIQAAAGVWVALILTFLFAVPILSFGPQMLKAKGKAGAEDAASSEKSRRTDIFDRFLAWTTKWVERAPRAIVLIFALAGAAALYGVSIIKIETNTIQDLPKDHAMRVAFEYVDQRMGGSMSMEFIVDTGEPDGIKSIAVMQDIERLQDYLEAHPMVTQTSSIVDQIKQMHRAIHENQESMYRLPEKDSQIAEYLLLYESGGGSQFEQFVNFTSSSTRIQARTQALRFREVRTLEQDVLDFVEASITSAEIKPTGTLNVISKLGEYIKVGQGQSFLFAFVVIALIMMLTLRSVSMGLIAMVPNVLPVLFGLGAMGLFGYQLNIIGLVLAPMVLGVAVDDTVHFFSRYRRYFATYNDHSLAYRETMRTVGRPLLFTTLALIAGFAGFLISIFNGPREFAISCGIAFSTALLAEFLLAPVLLKWFKPLGKGGGAEKRFASIETAKSS